MPEQRIIMLVAVAVAAVTLVALLTRLFVNVGSNSIAILERRFLGRELAPGRVFALAGEVGSKAAYLAPGLHVIFWPIIRVVAKPRFVTIGANELGIVEATDGGAAAFTTTIAAPPPATT